jgi:hypothetical protein
MTLIEMIDALINEQGYSNAEAIYFLYDCGVMPEDTFLYLTNLAGI